MNSQRSQGQAVSPASSGLSYPDCPIASRSGAGTYLIATYGAGAKARPSTRWGWTIKSAKTCLALRSGWYGCYQHRRDRMRLSSPSNVIRSLVMGGGCTVLPHRRPTFSSARPSRARGGPWLLVEEILGKSAGSKSPHLVTIPRHVCCYHAGNGGKNRVPGRSSTYRTGAKGRRL
jgi:hypothetical protein